MTAQPSRANVACSMSDASQEAKVWEKVFTFIPADKLKHNMVAVCSAHYAASLKSEFSSMSYELTNLLPNDVVKLSTDLINFWSVAFDRLDTPCLSYLYGTAKLHKTPFRLRYILGVSKKLSCSRFDSSQTDGQIPPRPVLASSLDSPLLQSRNAFNPIAKLLELSLKGLYVTLSTINQQPSQRKKTT